LLSDFCYIIRMQQKNSTHLKLLSVVIPAYKQEKTIVKDIKNIENTLLALKIKYEIIIIVDGLVDKTYQNALSLKSKKIKVIAYHRNEGKGHAIRHGMLLARGDIIGFLDAGMEINPKGLEVLLDKFKKYNMDIVIGSKRHPDSKVIYPLQRKIISFLSQKFIKLLFGLEVTDTQVGMKFFKRKVIKKVLPRLLVKKFAFDIEILSVAYYLGYKKISEAPIELTYDFKGSILSKNIINVLFYTLWDTCAVFYRLKIIHYYDRKKTIRVKSMTSYYISTS
jgi:glycosyltransferase involved in cell wall biosynthesis